jgi:hypothetical protein
MKYLLCNNGQCLPILSMNKNGRRYSCTLAYIKEQELMRINIQLFLYRDNNLYKNFNKTPLNECYSYKVIADGDGINLLINNKKRNK